MDVLLRTIYSFGYIHADFIGINRTVLLNLIESLIQETHPHVLENLVPFTTLGISNNLIPDLLNDKVTGFNTLANRGIRAHKPGVFD